jgi:hypothetical protein
MRRLNLRAPRIAGLLALALGAVALLALSGVAAAKDHGNDDHGHHGRHHHHHFREVREAGTISSFDATTGKLTIALTGGEAVTGLVTEDTRIRCERGDDHRFDRRDHGGGNEAGDDNGGQGTEPGDDNGGHGNEPGDDNGGQFEPGDDHGGQGNEPGDDNGGNSGSGGPGPSNSSGPGPSGEGNEGEAAEASCTVASLVTGAVVGEAELRLEGGVATFTEIDLGFDS